MPADVREDLAVGLRRRGEGQLRIDPAHHGQILGGVDGPAQVGVVGAVFDGVAGEAGRVLPQNVVGDVLARRRRRSLAVQPLQRLARAAVRVRLGRAREVTVPRLPERRDDTQVGDVVFAQVAFGYGTGTTILDGLDLHIRAGSSVAVVGATGSGKSTLARLLVRFYDVDDGAIRIDGVDVRDVPLDELRHRVAIVFEDTFLFNDTVAANIAFARPDASHDDIERAARLAGAHDFVVALPDAYDTKVGERGFSLSGGQRQRLALARAILADPHVLVLDDATSAVDPSKEHEIREAMATVMRGRTTIVIAHRPGTIALADTVVLLDEGRVAATGTHDELLAGSERYRAVLAAFAEDDDAAATAGGAA